MQRPQRATAPGQPTVWLRMARTSHSQSHITYRCKYCPACGQRADARHIITNECTYLRMPENVRDMLRQLLCAKIGQETLMLDAIESPEAHNMARALEKAAHTLFGDAPPPRNDEGWLEYTRGIRLLAGGLPEPSNDLMGLIKDGHNANFDPQKPPKRYTPGQPPAAKAATNQRQPPQAATSPGAMSADQLKTMKDDFMTTALRAARLTPPPPSNTAPPPEEPNDDSRYEQDAHF